MDIEFDDPDLDRLETDSSFTAGRPPAVVKGYRKVIGWVRKAIDERDLYGMRSLDFHPLDHDRKGQHALRLILTRFNGHLD